MAYVYEISLTIFLYCLFLSWNVQAKDIAEWKAKDIKMKMESMKQELQREKRASSTAVARLKVLKRRMLPLRRR